MAVLLSRICSQTYSLTVHRRINWHPVVRWLKRGDNTGISSFKRISKLTPEYQSTEEKIPFRKLFKPFLFTVGFTGSSFTIAAIWQYENMRKHASKYISQYSDLWQYRSSYKRGTFRKQLNEWWNSQTEGQKLAWGIIALNTIVLFLWHIPSLQPTMIRYFCSTPASKSLCWPMFLSTFSHYSWFHWSANMFVLYTFSSGAVSMLGKEQFLALYLSGGVISSFASYLFKLSTGKMGSSLGASGALLTIIAAVCVQYPDTRLSIIFFPFFTFSAGIALKAILAIDTAGLFLGWKLLDHAAHLGGSIYGISYILYGQEYLWNRRGSLMKLWHEWRER